MNFHSNSKHVALFTILSPSQNNLNSDSNHYRDDNVNNPNNVNIDTIGAYALARNNSIYSKKHIKSDKGMVVEFVEHEKVGVRKNVLKWTSADYLKYIGYKFENVYGLKSIEMTPYKSRKGITYSIIKNLLINVFESAGYTKVDLKNYIDWVYDSKSKNVDFPITLSFLKFKGLITEYLARSKGKKRIKKSKRELIKNQ